MAKQDRPRNEDWLARQLREEALEERPEFSDSLHERLSQAVRAAAEQTQSKRRPAGKMPSRRWSLGFATAAAILIAALLVWQVVKQPGASAPQENVVHNRPLPSAGEGDPNAAASVGELLAAMDLAHDAAAEFDAMADEVFAAHAWAYLDHDARLALDMIVDQIPLDALVDPAGSEDAGKG